MTKELRDILNSNDELRELYEFGKKLWLKQQYERIERESRDD